MKESEESNYNNHPAQRKGGGGGGGRRRRASTTAVMAERSNGGRSSSSSAAMTRTRSMGAMSAEEDLLNEIKKLADKLRVSEKNCTALQKHLQEAKRREQQLKSDQLQLLQKQKKLEKLSKGGSKSWKRRSKENFSGGSSHHVQQDHAEEIREGIKLNRLTLSSGGAHSSASGNNSSSSSTSGNTSPLVSSTGGRRPLKPSLNTYEEGAGAGRKRRESSARFARYEAMGDDDGGKFHSVFEDEFDSDNVGLELISDDDEDDEEYEEEGGRVLRL